MRGVELEALDRVLRTLPAAPKTLEELNINRGIARDIFLKTASFQTVYNTATVAQELRISSRLAAKLIDEARAAKLIEFRPSLTGGEPNFALSADGRAAAQVAFDQSSYVGPLPVSLDDYVRRVKLQSVHGERISPQVVEEVFADLHLSQERIRDIGAAANSSKSAMLYGPPGNGKTSMAERMGRLFRTFVFIPHCFEVAGNIVQVFDGSIHEPLVSEEGEPRGAASAINTIVAEEYDRRWVPCQRPFVFTGGELTPEMLELNFNPISKYYEAPLQVKANNGVFLIDDFGRQIIPPRVLLNRWIVPMDRRVDYLKLHTGRSFSLPFDALLLFSTNIGPDELMDPTFLRRISHKIYVGAPTDEEFRAIFRDVLKRTALGLDERWADYIIARIREHGGQLAAFQPYFIADQVRDLRRFVGGEVDDRVAVDFGLKNLLADASTTD
ncbi:hypothetical protein [Falsiroseomonas oryziterrae]|uniref:hypothetical protein n=1 Tax=Falsiroseomonas oryziterrae TaxID=2911368 RepID=UPI001F24B664|nr:hypothetical protein [Roseomonas sp. NPKOSM-4]